MAAAEPSGVGVVSRVAIDIDRVRSVVRALVDPEIPVLTIEDLGILRDVGVEGDKVIATITPTYSGCPALRQIEDDIVAGVTREGYDVEVRVQHNPPWTTDWINAEAMEKLAAFGIAPPTAPEEVLCPRCGGTDPKMVSLFGSTACKAFMVCSSCGEPFAYFKRF